MLFEPRVDGSTWEKTTFVDICIEIMQMSGWHIKYACILHEPTFKLIATFC